MRALVHTPTLDAATSNGSPDEEDNADRRAAGKVIAVGSLMALWVPSEALERIMTHDHRPVDARLIADHEDVADRLASLHSTISPDTLVDQVTHHADTLLALLDRPTAAGADRLRLEAVTAGSCAQAGVLAFWLNDRSIQRHYFSQARTVADDSGDDALRARTLSVIRIEHSYMKIGQFAGCNKRAVMLLRRAVHHSQRADHATRAFAQHWLGLELAAAGDERGFLDSCETAEHLLTHARSDDFGFFTRYLSMEPEAANRTRGFGLVRVGRAQEALNALQIPSLDSASLRSSLMTLTDIAATFVLQDEPDEACHTLVRALNLTLETGYPMGIERIRGVRARFPTTPTDWAKLPCVKEFDEQLKVAVASLQRKR